MAILSDAELLLGLSRHLSAYAMSPDRAGLGDLEFAGQVLEMAFRLRGSTTSPAPRVKAIGLDAGLGARLLTDVISTMEQFGWVTVQRDSSGAPQAVVEAIPAVADLLASAPRLLDIVAAGPTERASLALLRSTSLQPLLVEDALSGATMAVGCSDEESEEAQRHLTGVGLIRRVRADDGRDVLYNPNVWTQGDSIAAAALKAADARATKEVTALLEEVAATPGLPELHVSSTEVKWIQFAVSQGLVQRSVIQTIEGSEKGFLFTPHLARDPFGQQSGDASGHVRQLVGSMVYASTFAKYKLHTPDAFLRRLINNGVAGDVTSIGTDYPMLEKAGIVRVVPGSAEGRFRMELLQSDIAEDALGLMTSRQSGTGAPTAAAALQGQRSYVPVERERARLALTSSVDEIEQARLLAALREVPVERTIGGPR